MWYRALTFSLLPLTQRIPWNQRIPVSIILILSCGQPNFKLLNLVWVEDIFYLEVLCLRVDSTLRFYTISFVDWEKKKEKKKRKAEHNTSYLYPVRQIGPSSSSQTETNTFHAKTPANFPITSSAMEREWGTIQRYVTLILWPLLRPSLRRGLQHLIRRLAGVLFRPRISDWYWGINSWIYWRWKELRAWIRLLGQVSVTLARRLRSRGICCMDS